MARHHWQNIMGGWHVEPLGHLSFAQLLLHVFGPMSFTYPAGQSRSFGFGMIAGEPGGTVS